MQRIKNIEETILQLKPMLRKYLEGNSTQFRGSLFTCPNRAEHKNNDSTPSSGFVPGTEETVFNCFSCGKSGDIFTAYSLLESKEINGANWYVTVKELADRYGVKYELEPLLLEEQEFNNIQTFLKTLVKNANQYLIKNNPEAVTKYIKSRSWEDCVGHFELGFLPDNQKVREFIARSFQMYPELPRHLAVDIQKPQDFANGITNRLIYPITHRYGYILGLVDRSISDKDTRQKYVKHFLKSCEKGGVLYNLTKTYKSVYIVEGASSVFTLHNNGVKNVVATLGTAFTEQMYSSLIKHGIDRVVLCFDGDEPGQQALQKALELTQNKSDIKIVVKVLDRDKDPDDIIKESGVEYFKNIPEVSNFRFQLTLFQNAKEEEQEKHKKFLFEVIISTKDAILREKMLKLFIQETGVLKTTLVDEIERYEKTKGIISDVGVGEILKEETSLIQAIESFEEKALRCGRLKGISIGFPIFDEKLDGLQTGLALVSGRWNTGKSAFIQSIMLNLLKEPTNYVLYFSLDDSTIGVTLPRFVANLSQIPINTVSNPIYRIDKNEILTEVEKLTLRNKRNEALVILKSYAGRLGIKDSTEGYDTDFIDRITKIYKVLAGSRKLIIFVDFFNMVKLSRYKSNDQTQLETELIGFFKRLAILYDAPVICTAEGTKDVSEIEMKESAIKGSASIQFRSDLTLLLSSDFEVSNKSEMYFYDDSGVAQPIVQIRMSKNKMSGYKKNVYFKFYRDQNLFIECNQMEQQEYGRKG